MEPEHHSFDPCEFLPVCIVHRGGSTESIKLVIQTLVLVMLFLSTTLGERIWVFPKIGVPQKWMVYNGKPY